MQQTGVDVYYFSGTGNTLLVVRKIAEVLREAGVDVRLLPMEDGRPPRVEPNRLLGLAFPVVCLSTFPFVWDFLGSLPPADGTEVFMVTTRAGITGGLKGPLRRLLKRKGYHPVGAVEIVMPPNIFWVMDDAWNKRRQTLGLARAAAFAGRLLSGRARWRSLPLLSDLMGLITRRALNLMHWEPHQRFLRHRAGRELCSGCGICARLCPVGNITIDAGTAEFGLKCQYCLRCLSFCPTRAIKSRLIRKNRTYRAVDVEDLLKRA